MSPLSSTIARDWARVCSARTSPSPRIPRVRSITLRRRSRRGAVTHPRASGGLQRARRVTEDAFGTLGRRAPAGALVPHSPATTDLGYHRRGRKLRYLCACFRGLGLAPSLRVPPFDDIHASGPGTRTLVGAGGGNRRRSPRAGDGFLPLRPGPRAKRRPCDASRSLPRHAGAIARDHASRRVAACWLGRQLFRRSRQRRCASHS